VACDAPTKNRNDPNLEIQPMLDLDVKYGSYNLSVRQTATAY